MKDGEKTYSTSQIAGIVGLHPNTVRKYEEWDYCKHLNVNQMDIGFIQMFILNSLNLQRKPYRVL